MPYVRYSAACGVRQLTSHLHHRRALARTHCAILRPPLHGLLPSDDVTVNVPVVMSRSALVRSIGLLTRPGKHVLDESQCKQGQWNIVTVTA